MCDRNFGAEGQTYLVTRILNLTQVSSCGLHKLFHLDVMIGRIVGLPPCRTATNERFAAKFCTKEDSMEVNIVQELPRQLVTHENFIKYELIVLSSGKYT